MNYGTVSLTVALVLTAAKGQWFKAGNDNVLERPHSTELSNIVWS